MNTVKQIILLLVLALLFNKTQCQNIIKAKVFDFEKNTVLQDVSIRVQGTKKGTYSNTEGIFILENITPDNILVFSKIGYETRLINAQNINKKIYLEQEIKALSEVRLRTFSSSQLKKVTPDQIYFSKQDINRLPFILGEKDVIKLIQYTPGVQQATEGQAGFIVRGGNSSMNLTLLDNIYLHNTAHLGGLFSAINSDFVKSLEFSKGGFDARFGGRVSSITDIKTLKTTNTTNFSGSLGLLSAKLTGNIKVNEKHNILLSGRRTYFDAVKPFIKSQDGILSKDSNYFLYDFLAKHTFKTSKKGQLETLFYSTKDDFFDKTKGRDRQLDWGNILIGTTYTHKFSEHLTSETAISNSLYEFSFASNDVIFDYNVTNSVNIINLSHHFKWKLPKYILKIGASYNRNNILPKKVRATVNNSPLKILNQDVFKYDDVNIFGDWEFSISEKTKIKTGLRLTLFKNKANPLINSAVFYSVEPRLSIKHQFKANQAFKFSYQRLSQFIHQASIDSFSLPADFFVISTDAVKPQVANQASLGYVYETNDLQFNSALYFKNVNNYSEFANGSINNIFSNNIYTDIVLGHFNAFGLELSASKKIDKLTAQSALTLSRTFAKFNEINQGQYFPTNFDRPININTIVNYKLNNKVELGVLFLYTSGQNYTRPRDIRIINEEPIINFESKNASRYPSYHRLDLSCTYAFKPKGSWQSKLNLTLYNVYNNKNPFQITFSTDGNANDAFVEIIETRDNLFPFLPTINWLFSF